MKKTFYYLAVLWLLLLLYACNDGGSSNKANPATGANATAERWSVEKSEPMVCRAALVRRR
ncbi:hypothetical protein KRR40_01645 [Niabella defluvii]|nr:hypothetical protein KRR40_01645 [Niabella sp. I65]